ncbi:MAG: hypothetical protein K1X88_36430 [Nannocystaceae bacterium]|nr:hypothetical protein [Nannocystaceae bacterium]
MSKHSVLVDAPRSRARALCSLAALLLLAACDPWDSRLPTDPLPTNDPPSEPDPGGSTAPQQDACNAPHDDWYGCPGNPCAHGWCAVGECVGMIVDHDGNLVDPGVCCTDDECLEG